MNHWAYTKFACQDSWTIPVPDWVKDLIDDWLQSAGISTGRIFRRVRRTGTVWGTGVSEKVVWHVVRQYARKAGIEKLAPHDLRRTCARLCHQAGGELDQIQFLLGHVSVQTTVMLRLVPDSLHGARDRVILPVGFAAAFRRSEFVALDVTDLKIQGEGLLMPYAGRKPIKKEKVGT